MYLCRARRRVRFSIDIAISILRSLKYFEHAPAELFGHKCRLSRTGYSGERGYEIFIDAECVGDVWDKLVAEQVMPCSFTALDKLRIEAGLLFYGYDMTDKNTPWEVGLGFTVADSKGEFRGRDAVMSARGKETVTNICLDIDHNEALVGGETLWIDGQEVGVVNSPCYSNRMKKSLALAHIKTGIAENAVLQVSGDGIDTTATVVASPVYDPKKSRTHS